MQCLNLLSAIDVPESVTIKEEEEGRKRTETFGWSLLLYFHMVEQKTFNFLKIRNNSDRMGATLKMPFGNAVQGWWNIIYGLGFSMLSSFLLSSTTPNQILCPGYTSPGADSENFCCTPRRT